MELRVNARRYFQSEGGEKEVWIDLKRYITEL